MVNLTMQSMDQGVVCTWESQLQVTRPQMVYRPQTVDHDLFCPQTLHFHNFCLKITPNSLYMSFFTKNNFLSKFVKMHRFYRVANIIGHFFGVFDFV